MGVLTRTTDVPPVVNAWFNKDLLLRVVPYLAHGKVALRKPLPGRNTKTVIFRRIEPLSLATTPLVEGVPPSGSKITYTDVSSSIKQYGDYVPLSDLVQAVVEHPILMDANKVLAEQASQTLDALLRDVFVAGTSVLYGGGVASRSLLVSPAQKVDKSVLRRAVRLLLSNNARMFTRIITATDKVSTTPVRPAYWAITSPDVLFNLEELPGWIPVEKYASQGPVMDGEVGAFENIRFIVTTQAKQYPEGGGAVSGDVQGTTNADVHTILIFGQEAVATVPLDNMSFETIIHPKGSAGTGDPLNQYGTSGWKRTGTELILNDNFFTRIEVTVTDVAP